MIMPSHEEHCQDSLKRYGKRFDELHSWMDEPSTMLARDHRIHRHDPVSTPPIAKRLFGELADQACIDHIRLDRLEEKRLKKEEAKKPKQRKKGYWKNHNFHKVSMKEEITEYCGEKFLEELIEKCNETPYRVNQDYLRKRDKALIATLFLTGGRVSEVLMLKKNNFDFDNEEAKRNNAFLVKDMKLLKHYTVKGKPRYVTRTFPIWYDEPLVQYLPEWLLEIEDYLFPSGKEKNRPMTRYRASQIISDLGKHRDIRTHINPSWFRFQREHYLVKEKGFSPYDVQAYMKLRNPPTIFRNRKDWQNLLVLARPPRQEKVYEKTPYDAYKGIQNIIISARKELDIIDPFVDDSIFELYLYDVHPNVNIKLITRNMYGKFKEVAKRFKIQKPNFEIKTSNEVHDRYLIVDDRVWVIGQSLKDAGMKPLYIVELHDKYTVLDLFKKLWNRAKKELS